MFPVSISCFKVALTTYFYTYSIHHFVHEGSSFFKVEEKGEREQKRKIGHLIGWMNSSDLCDPSVSCNEFINPSNNDPNQLQGVGWGNTLVCYV